MDSDNNSDAGIQNADYPEFNELADIKRTIKLSVGMRFNNTTWFKKGLQFYSIQDGFDFMHKKNKTSRLTAICKHGCDEGFMFHQ